MPAKAGEKKKHEKQRGPVPKINRDIGEPGKQEPSRAIIYLTSKRSPQKSELKHRGTKGGTESYSKKPGKKRTARKRFYVGNAAKKNGSPCQ